MIVTSGDIKGVEQTEHLAKIDMPSDDRTRREHVLRKEVLRGSQRAWQELYENAYETLYRYVRWRCAGLSEIADEITQETWLIAIGRIRQFDPASCKFATWLRGIASHLLRNYFRKVSRRPKQDTVALHQLLAIDHTREDVERAEEIAWALAVLPDRYEAVLRAKYLEERDVADIALERNESVKAVESTLNRARQAFREAFEKQSTHFERETES